MLLRPEDVNGYRIPGLPALNEAQTTFFVAVMNGETPVKAYQRAYPNTKKEYIDPASKQVLRSQWYNKYKDYYTSVIEKRALNEAVWNLELSLLERRRLYSLNLVEVERLAGAHAKAIEYYIRKREEAMDNGDDKKVEYYEEKIIKETKAKNMAIASNQACLDALDGLDKLMGLQTVNIHHTSDVNFVGEDMWDDDISGSEPEEETENG